MQVPRLKLGIRTCKQLCSAFPLVMRHSSVSAAVVSVSKDPTLADEPFRLSISGLSPNHKVTLHSSIRLPNSTLFESLAHYIADGNGCISLDHQESHGGSFTGIEPMGPLSFMEPSPLNKRTYERFLIKEPTKPFNIDFRVLDQFILSFDDPSAQDRFESPPHLTITRRYMLPGVKEIPVWDGRVRATLYVPEGEGPFPGIISMSGGYPGAMKYKGALWASHGFATLALKYFGEDDLPNDFFNLELDYIEEAVMFMTNNKLVDSRRGIGIVANCYGGTIGLSAASVLPKGLIRCVVSVSGWSFPMGVISYKGKVLELAANPIRISELTDDGLRSWKFTLPGDDTSLEFKTKCSVKFFDKHEISYMFVAGEEDAYLDSSDLEPAMNGLLESADHPDYETLLYKGAGHLIEHSYYPLSSVAWTFKEPHLCGGKQPGHSIAQIDSWPKILDFVRKRLCLPDSKL